MVKDFRTKVQLYLNHGESVQIIAPKGFGKSRFGRSLGGLFLDTNLLQTPEELLSQIKSSSERRLIIIDSLDQLLDERYRFLFGYLKALRDQFRHQLSYVFLTHKLIGPEFLPILGDLYELASEHIEHLPDLDPSEYDTFGFSPTSKQLEEIKDLTGGIPALVKICMQSMRDGIKIDPQTNPRLKAQLEETITSCPDHPAYKNSQLLQNYLSHRSPASLTAAETRLLNLLLTHKSEIVTKDQICQVVYPDVKNAAGITAHALDQLVHRLRSKVTSRYTITTHRCLGYQLS